MIGFHNKFIHSSTNLSHMLQNGTIGVYFKGEYSYLSTWMFLKIELNIIS